MVKGLNLFKEHFANFVDRYVLIGGTASSVAMEDLGVEFRVTKDLDVVLVVEALDATFVEAFWQFVKLGDYENRQKSTGERLFYRFHSPSDKQFPFMIELFSRQPDALDLIEDNGLTPIHVEETVSSLSAILMDEDYYHFILENRIEVDGLSVVGANVLIPLKAKAFTDLYRRKQLGETIDTKDIKKHRSDIFRLYGILELGNRIYCPETIRNDLSEAFELINAEKLDLKPFGIRSKSQVDVINELTEYYHS